MVEDREAWMAQAESEGVSPDVAARRWEEKMNVPSDSAGQPRDEPVVDYAPGIPALPKPVARYDASTIMWSLDGNSLVPSAEGEYVRYADHAALLQAAIATATDTGIAAIMRAIEDVMIDAEVDFPAGREAGTRISYDTEALEALIRIALYAPVAK